MHRVYRLPFAGLLAAVLLASGAAARAAQPLATPLEEHGYSRISSSAEVSAYLARLVAAAPQVELEVVGRSARGQAIETLVFRGADRGPQLRVLIVASQHGAAEPAGTEAALALARELTTAEFGTLLETLDVILLPNANPDGRDLGRRSNANGVNINTDFVRAREPETRAVLAAIARHAPHVLLDTHESAVLKRKSLGLEGYLTDFEIQFEIATNPGVSPALREVSEQQLLPALIQAARAAGYDADRYIGEVTSTHQVITHGGLTLRNLRNTAGVVGVVSMLVETRLDSGEGRYPTWHNIAVRETRQLFCLRTFLATLHARREAVLDAYAAPSGGAFPLHAAYVLDSAHPHVDITLRRRDDGTAVVQRFPDHRKIEVADVVEPPAAYLVTHGAALLRPVLEAHAIAYEVVSARRPYRVMAQRFLPADTAAGRANLLASEAIELEAQPGMLVVRPNAGQARQALLLLDPRSPSSVFRYPEFASLLDPARAHTALPLLSPPASSP